jgi:hypothetical protein
VNLDAVLTTAIADLSTQVSSGFTTIAPFVLLTGVGFAAWKYVKRFLSKA